MVEMVSNEKRSEGRSEEAAEAAGSKLFREGIKTFIPWVSTCIEMNYLLKSRCIIRNVLKSGLDNCG